MTNATVLADALVEAGILDYVGNHREMSRPGYTELGRFYWVKGDETMEDEALGHDAIITDWRVAGKVLEDWSFDLDDHAFTTVNFEAVATTDWLRDPRAIVEAWYEARQ